VGDQRNDFINTTHGTKSEWLKQNKIAKTELNFKITIVGRPGFDSLVESDQKIQKVDIHSFLA